MGSLPCVTSLEQQRKLMTAKLKKLDEDIALKNADNVDADMEPVFRGLCKRQRVSFQRGTWSVPVRKLRKLNKSDKAQAFTREVLDLIKYTRQEEQKAIVARAEAREKLRRLVDGYYGKITAEFPAKL
jgi:CHASE3 domain sensor protein